LKIPCRPDENIFPCPQLSNHVLDTAYGGPPPGFASTLVVAAAPALLKTVPLTPTAVPDAPLLAAGEVRWTMNSFLRRDYFARGALPPALFLDRCGSFGLADATASYYVPPLVAWATAPIGKLTLAPTLTMPGR
jgi:5-hydroxyisourate hydrolase-like protein (transthyretin family)